ncbi:hypothetical protein AB0P17_11610 [Streptomyces sp. NPDC088124]|uniref:hypothetical protein n=1 Tax=Streptomyces sp. NPDC088124 TaxID=3154654 RepID=UPI0034166C2A
MPVKVPLEETAFNADRIARTGRPLDALAVLTRCRTAELTGTVSTIVTPPVPQLEDVMHPARAYQPPGTERRFSAVPHGVGSSIRSATPDTGWAA